MEKAQEVYREGFMSHLDQLMVLSKNLNTKQQRRRQQEAELQENQEQILRLQRERDELRSKVQLQKEELKALSAGPERRQPSAYSTAQTLRDLMLEEKASNMEALWFTGISGRITDDGVWFCISTAYEGTYLDSYNLKVSDLEKPRILKHSIPPFIPLSELSRDNLPGNLKKLLSLLSDQLNAYAGRKFQVDQMEKTAQAYIPGTLQRNSLHTVLSFHYNVTIDGQQYRFAARLFYGDINRILPTEVKITCSDDVASLQEVISSQESMFSKLPIHRALESVTT